MRRLALALLLPAAAFAQAATPPPTPPPDCDEAPDHPDCPRREPPTHFGGGGLHVGPVPAPQLPASRPSSSGGSSLNGGNIPGEAILAVVVVAAAALPFIVYALDEPANDEQLRVHHAPTATAELIAGGVSLPRSSHVAFTAGLRGAVSYGAIGVGGSFHTAPLSSFHDLQADFRLRPPPRQHIEGALSIGWRQTAFGPDSRDYFELSLPHRYVFARKGNQGFGLELRPALLVARQDADVSLDAGFSIPVFESSTVRAGGRVFSFETDVHYAVNAGFSTSF
ncbi:MAG: hypothetical protein HYZ28_10530 [Myxococcales bacterium]|nr:hypothetical protein [Myxococcales bacterium]